MQEGHFKEGQEAEALRANGSSDGQLGKHGIVEFEHVHATNDSACMPSEMGMEMSKGNIECCNTFSSEEG